jgi:hypothetical protein
VSFAAFLKIVFVYPASSQLSISCESKQGTQSNSAREPVAKLDDAWTPTPL